MPSSNPQPTKTVTTKAPSYYILTPNGFVAGFSKSMQLVQCTPAEYRTTYGKAFKTPLAATKWILAHTGKGYGFNQETATIEQF